MERKLIAVAVSTALGLPMAADAVEGSVSGHVNRALVLVDQNGDPNDGMVRHVDANSSQTRFRFTGSGELDNGVTAGLTLEYGASSSNLNLRHSYVYLDSAGGKVSIGHTGDAADGMIYARLGGPSWLGGVTNWCSYHSTGQGCITVDGGRSPVLKYDTPAIGALSVSASVGNDDAWHTQARVAGSFGDGGYALHLGYVGDNGSGEDMIGASAAVKFAQGTAVAVSWGENSDAGVEAQHIELDHSYGGGSIGVYYRQGEDNAGTGSAWGVGVGHGLGNGATAYAGYRMMEGEGVDDANVFFAGMRVTFN